MVYQSLALEEILMKEWKQNTSPGFEGTLESLQLQAFMLILQARILGNYAVFVRLVVLLMLII